MKKIVFFKWKKWKYQSKCSTKWSFQVIFFTLVLDAVFIFMPIQVPCAGTSCSTLITFDDFPFDWGFIQSFFVCRFNCSNKKKIKWKFVSNGNNDTNIRFVLPLFVFRIFFLASRISLMLTIFLWWSFKCLFSM